MSALQMGLVAGGIFLAELFAVVAVVVSLFLERWLGLSRGVVLDWVFIVAVSYVPAAWIVGTLLMRSFAGKSAANKETADPLPLAQARK